MGHANGSAVQLYSCAGHTNQIWEPFNGGWRNLGSGRCLDIPWANSTNGTKLQIWDCNGQTQQTWTPLSTTRPMASTAPVTDGNWHHVVLTAGATSQTLYLDGVSQATITGKTVDHRDSAYAYIGNGRASPGLPGGPVFPPLTPVGTFAFPGHIDDVAYYRHPLAQSQVTAHYQARTGASRLATVVEPGNFTATTVTYDPVSGRVSTEKDRHGATWTVSPPELVTESVVGGGVINERRVTVSSTSRGAVTYGYDTTYGGRQSSRREGTDEPKKWAYNAETGFVSSVTDENGDATEFETDERGNVIKRTTTRTGTTKYSEYFGYYLNQDVPFDPLDPRNDVQVWSADARSANKDDATYRITRTIDAVGRPTSINYPKPQGQSNNPTATYTYTTGSVVPPGYSTTSTTGSFVPATTTRLGIDGDDGVVQVALPFPVPFYGQNQSQLWVSADGYGTFTDMNLPASQWPWSTALPPDVSKPNHAVMPMLDDWIINQALYSDPALKPGVYTATTGTAPNRKFIVEWRNVHRYGAVGTMVSFEMLLSENGTIEFRYDGIDSFNAVERGSLATIAVENAAGTAATVFSHRQAAVDTGKIITFSPTGHQDVPAGLLLTATSPVGGVTTYTYNAAGDLVTSTDPVGLVTTNTYDGLGRVATTGTSATVNGTVVDYGTKSVTYNGLSEPLTVTAPAVRNPVTNVLHTPVATYQYDAAGRLTSQSIADSTGGDATRSTALVYDPAGRLLSNDGAGRFGHVTDLGHGRRRRHGDETRRSRAHL